MEITEDKLQELNEQHYINGQRSVLVKQLYKALHELSIPYSNVDALPENLMTITRLTIEREQTIAALRSACEDHGDNEWNEDLHMADIVNKHLVRHLD